MKYKLVFSPYTDPVVVETEDVSVACGTYRMSDTYDTITVKRIVTPGEFFSNIDDQRTIDGIVDVLVDLVHFGHKPNATKHALKFSRRGVMEAKKFVDDIIVPMAKKARHIK